MNVCGTCGQNLNAFARRCPVCETPAVANLRRFRRLGYLAATIGALGLSAFLMLRPGRARSPDPVDPEDPARYPRPVALVSECSVVPVAVDRASLAELEAIPSARFGIGYAKLLRESRVIEVPVNTKGILLDEENSHARVRIEFAGADRELWAPGEWLRAPGVDWSPSVREGAKSGR